MTTELEPKTVATATDLVAAISQGAKVLVAFDPKVVSRAATLARMAENWPVVTSVEEHAAAADKFRAIRDLKKTIEDNRVSVTKPLLDAQRAVKARADEITAQLDRGERMLRDRLSVFEAAERQREAEREAQRRAEAAERARVAAEEAARQREAELARTPDDAPYQLDEVPQTAPPVVEAPAPAPAAPAMKSVTSVRKVQTLKIVDVALIPAELNGVRLLVPDEAAILKLLKAGLTIPGCELEESTTTTARGGR